MSDTGATVEPGLDQELFDSADAFVGWCNAAGGILGRKINLHKRDAALFQVPAKMTEACQAPDFALVGNLEVLDNLGVQPRLACKLPEIPAADNAIEASMAPLSVQPIPVPADEDPSSGPFKALAKYDPSVLAHGGVLYLNLASTLTSTLRAKETLEALGYKLDMYQSVPVQVDNYRPFAQSVKDHGVQAFFFPISPAQLTALYRSMADLGSCPKYTLEVSNVYDPKTLAAGAALNCSQGGVYAYLTIVPFELASEYPGVKQYIDLLGQYANGAKPRQLGVTAFSAWLLFAESAKACGSNLTRQCLLDHAQTTKNWTAGGLQAPTDPANGATAHVTPCFVLIKVTPSGFVVDKAITKPDNGVFNCDPANVTKVKSVAP
jgi:hypothetical protein